MTMGKNKWLFGNLFGISLFLLLIGGCSQTLTRNVYRPAVWLTDFEEAKVKAKQLNFPILAAFVGLDWCPWCQKLEEEIFAEPEFLAYAKTHFVLFQADYPQYKEQPLKIKEQNKALAKTYSIEGLPTVLILDSAGNKRAETGYRRGGVKAYLEHLDNLLKK